MELIGHMADNVTGDGARAMLELLCRQELIDRRAAEELFVHREMERLVRSGTARCKAMHRIADKLCCSYEKVRGMVYAPHIRR